MVEMDAYQVAKGKNGLCLGKISYSKTEMYHKISRDCERKPVIAKSLCPHQGKGK